MARAAQAAAPRRSAPACRSWLHHTTHTHKQQRAADKGQPTGWTVQAGRTSAISPGLPVLAAAAWIAPMKSRVGGAALAAAISVASGTFSLQRQAGRQAAAQPWDAGSSGDGSSGGGCTRRQVATRGGSSGRRDAPGELQTSYGRRSHRQRSISTALYHTISSRMLRGWFSSARPSALSSSRRGQSGRTRARACAGARAAAAPGALQRCTCSQQAAGEQQQAAAGEQAAARGRTLQRDLEVHGAAVLLLDAVRRPPPDRHLLHGPQAERRGGEPQAAGGRRQAAAADSAAPAAAAARPTSVPSTLHACRELLQARWGRTAKGGSPPSLPRSP